MPTMPVNGVETYYEVQGEGTPVLFIHGGFGGAPSTLVPSERVITGLLPQDRIRLITYDRRSCGQSQYILEPYTLEDLAADARALLDRLGIERAIVIGDSMGGMVAQQYALSFPETVIALALVETGVDLMDDTVWGKQMRDEVAWAERDGAAAVFEARRDRLRNPPAPPATQEFPQELAERVRAQQSAYADAVAQISDDELLTYFAGALRNEAAFIGYDFENDLGAFSMPVCVIHGNADRVVPLDLGQELRDWIPGAEFHEIEGGTHGILAFAAAAEALRDWVLRMATAG
jgi:pimeloyl-ACP methyl ester carboxylesterase